MTTTESNRARRFSLPDLADERVDEAIDAFLAGPARRRSRPDERAAQVVTGNAFGGLENRVTWEEALHRESARVQRYRRPAAVLVFSALAADQGRGQSWLARVAAPIAHSICRGVRETDLVTRTADARFQVLLPETTGKAARRLAERIVGDCDVWLRAMGAPISLRAAAVGTAADVTLEAALKEALRLVELS